MRSDSSAPPSGARTAVRVALGALLAFGALNAFGGSYYGLSGAAEVPREWLRGSPAFGAYLIMILAMGWPSLPRGFGRSRG
jgi:hypothetical protein